MTRLSAGARVGPYEILALLGKGGMGEAYRGPTPPIDCVPDLLALGLPHWRAVAEVDMRHHVRRERLAEPGDQRQLFELVAELHRERLDRARPVFRLHVIEGLETGQVAIYLKSHHASWDGRTALARIFGTLANEPGPIRAPFFALPPQPSPHAPQDGAGPGLAEGARSLLSHAIAARELLSASAVRRNRLRDEPRSPAGNQPLPRQIEQTCAALHTMHLAALSLFVHHSQSAILTMNSWSSCTTR